MKEDDVNGPYASGPSSLCKIRSGHQSDEDGVPQDGSGVENSGAENEEADCEENYNHISDGQNHGEDDTGKDAENGEDGSEKNKGNDDDKTNYNSNNGNSNYVDFYHRITCTLQRCGVTFVGHLAAGKTGLRDALLGKTFRETQSTNGIELSTCTVSKTSLETRGTRWEERAEPFHEHICEDLDRIVAGGATETTTNQPERNISEMTLWDMSGEFAFYKTHPIFLFPSNAFLVVMDVMKGLDEVLPQSCATKAQTGKIACPKTPREFLDFWLNTIGTYATNYTNDLDAAEVCPNIIIVLTHTDLLEPQKRQSKIQKYKISVLKYLKS